MRNKIAAIATFLATPLALALPQPYPTSAASATVTPPSSYYLKTRVVDHGHFDKDGLYVSNYHTGMKEILDSGTLCPPEKSGITAAKTNLAGAGTADLTLQSIDSASPAFFNSGYQEFNLDPPEPFGITMGDYDNGGTGKSNMSLPYQ